uniref:Ribosomal protein S13 n=1 Tax=Proschkinia sp. SZCZR1824 TaxID=2588390 RepID=A0A4Y5SFU0_9STRA|nr:ribosomal protein S13 [Proschkinia sp. SZCZR1824]
MIYLFEVELQENQFVYKAFTKIFGIGHTKTSFICKKLGFSKNYKVKDLTKSQILKITNLLELSQFVLSSDLQKVKSLNLQRLISIKSYRGLRLRQGLPVRGQRTHTNGRTSKKRLV